MAVDPGEVGGVGAGLTGCLLPKDCKGEGSLPCALALGPTGSRRPGPEGRGSGGLSTPAALLTLRNRLGRATAHPATGGPRPGA